MQTRRGPSGGHGPGSSCPGGAPLRSRPAEPISRPLGSEGRAVLPQDRAEPLQPRPTRAQRRGQGIQALGVHLDAATVG